MSVGDRLKETELLNYFKGCNGMEMGRHSGIPDCCILFWITIYMPSLGQHGTKSPYYISRVTNNKFGYIPCNNCFEKGNKVKMHVCTKRCNKWLRLNGFEPKHMTSYPTK